MGYFVIEKSGLPSVPPSLKQLQVPSIQFEFESLFMFACSVQIRQITKKSILSPHSLRRNWWRMQISKSLSSVAA